MLKAGIIDPKKVTRVVIENAASVAGNDLNYRVCFNTLLKEEGGAECQWAAVCQE
jgi:hypothetical protein